MLPKSLPFPRQRQAVSQRPPPWVPYDEGESSDREECTGDHFGCFSPGWPAGGFSETSGSVRLSLVTQPTRSFIDQCNSRLTEVSLAVNTVGLVVSMPDAECLRGM